VGLDPKPNSSFNYQKPSRGREIGSPIFGNHYCSTVIAMGVEGILTTHRENKFVADYNKLHSFTENMDHFVIHIVISII
jgi:hypothetical protein